MSRTAPSPFTLSLGWLLACGGQGTVEPESKDGRDSEFARDSSGSDTAGGDSGEPVPAACPDAVATCAGNECRFDMNLVAHVLGGTLTYDGGAIPDSADGSGSDYLVWVTDQETGGKIHESFTFDQPWSLTLAAGTYDVFAQLRVHGRETHMGATAKIADDLELAGDTTLDADLVPFAVGGRTTFLGGAVPDTRDADDYEVRVLAADGVEVEAKFAADEPWATLLPAGHYDAWVRIFGGSSAAQREWAWAGALDVAADTRLHLDAAFPVVAGHPTLDGADLEDSRPGPEVDHGIELTEITTRDQFDGWYLHDEDVQIEVAAGVYDVEWISVTGDASGLSRYLSVTTPSVSLTADTTLDLAFETLTIGGTVTLDGIVVPDTAFDLDYCVHFTASDGLSSGRSCGASGESWSAQLPPGSFDIDVSLASDKGDATGGRPRHRVATGLELLDGGQHDFDTSFALLSGRFTYASGPMPNPRHDPREAYTVTATDVETGSAYSDSFPFSRPFVLDLPTGVYDVDVRIRTEGSTPIVSQTYRAASALVVAADTTLSVDIPVTRLVGEVRYEGFLVDNLERHDSWVKLSSENGFEDTRYFPAAEGLAVRLWPGTYEVWAGLAVESRDSDLDGGVRVARCLLVEP